jgi:uncharacterized cupredoxin-like copper-binding protein
LQIGICEMRTTCFFSLPATLAALVLVGTQTAMAGSQPSMDGMPGMDGSGQSEFAFGHPGAADKADMVVDITMRDMSFEPRSVQVAAGRTIRFVITNRSEVDHDFTIGDAPTQQAHRAEMLEAMQSGSMAHGHDPNAVMVKAGERRELTWTFTQPGLLEFDCNIPGHFEAGMKGSITVSQANVPAG